MPEIEGIRVPFLPAGGIQELERQSKYTPDVNVRTSFDEIFNTELNKIKFSAHAQNRINSRDIQIDDESVERLNSAVEKAEEKGSRESLVIFDDKAFIVNIPSKTIITALDKMQLNSNIITNIDSAVFA
ncbi:MAG TPA: TIGR02530 family flagellar biosynthesis protein [Candidatus Kapabacteria bacterium]|nr:TIGR02530 family flagellar biosynthesis protein [Candidatus Kapabacteria bacterium]HPO63580.1 TIGR02530 family flagellar biosynthesis protein [Candidatus Kapabacteria bacterium]